MNLTDATHDPQLRSWVDSANTADTDFPIQNLPFGRFRRSGTDEPCRIGVAIGDQVLDLRQAREVCPCSSDLHALLEPLAVGDLNAFMALGRPAWRAVRAGLSAALSSVTVDEGLGFRKVTASSSSATGIHWRISRCVFRFPPTCRMDLPPSARPTPFPFSASATIGKKVSATAAFTNSVSSALHTPGFWVLEFTTRLTAISRSAAASTYTWQMPS